MALRSPWTCILWDIDGTVVDASDGILRRLTLALAELGFPPPTRADLVNWIGPPMHESFQKNLGLTPEQAASATEMYRRIGRADGYTTGAKLYPGVGELIAELGDAGIPQATASSKPELQVAALVEHFDLARYLQAVVGATPDEKTLASKEAIIAEALRRLGALGVDTSRPVLIGDRHHDIEGGAVHGIPVIFVQWGFSWPHEGEGAAAQVDDAAELRALLVAAEQ